MESPMMALLTRRESYQAMTERRHGMNFGEGGRPENAPGAVPGQALAVRLMTLRELALAFLREVDSIKSGGPPEGEPGLVFSEEVRRLEADLLRWALTRTGGHQSRAARLLNLNASTLNVLIKRHRIKPRAFETADDDH